MPKVHWPRKGVWGCAALKTPFSPLLQFARVPFQAKQSVHKTPLRIFGNFILYSLNFHPNFSSQAPKFGNFQLTSPQIWKFSVHKPQIWKFSVHKPPFSEANISSQAPHFGIQAAHPYLKKSWVPPGWSVWMTYCPLKGYWTWGGFSNYFLKECAARGLKPLLISKDFSHSKNGWIDSFLKIFTNWESFLRVFLPQKWLILPFFCKFCEMGSSYRDFFLPKWDPCLRIFCEKVTPQFGQHIPVCLNMQAPPWYWTLNFIIITPHFPQNTDIVSHVGLCSSC